MTDTDPLAYDTYGDLIEPFEQPPLSEEPTEVTVAELNKQKLRNMLAEQLEEEWGLVDPDNLKSATEMGLFAPDLSKINLSRLSQDFRKRVLLAVVLTYVREHPEGRTLNEIARALGLEVDRVRATLKSTPETLPPVPVKVRRCRCFDPTGSSDCGRTFEGHNTFYVYGWLYPARNSGRYNEYLTACQLGTRGDIAAQLALAQNVGHWDELSPMVEEMTQELFLAMSAVVSAYTSKPDHYDADEQHYTDGRDLL